MSRSSMCCVIWSSGLCSQAESTTMLVSVVIPSYNHCQYVVQAIESVLDQDWPEIDLIVIDDGSKDGSPEMIRELHERRGGFRFIMRENRGLIATLNELVALALGDALCLLASDDYLLPGSLSVRASFLLENPDSVAAVADGRQFNVETQNMEVTLDDRRRRLFLLPEPLKEMLAGLHLPIHTMLVRRRILNKIGGFDPRYRKVEDLEVQIRLFREGKVGFVDQPVYCYRWHESNTSRVDRQCARVDRVLCYKKLLEEVPEFASYRKLLRYRLRRQYLLLARYLLDKGGGTLEEREVVFHGWGMAWQDPRLLVDLVRLKFYPVQ